MGRRELWLLTPWRDRRTILNMLFPNNDYPVSEGDRFVLLTSQMPGVLRHSGAGGEDSTKEGMKVLADYTLGQAPSMKPQIDAKV